MKAQNATKAYENRRFQILTRSERVVLIQAPGAFGT